MKTVAQYHAGTTAAGTLTALFLALLAGGTRGLLAGFDDFEEEPIKFMAEGWFAAQLGPIFNMTARLWSDRKVEDLWMISAPVSVMVELTTFATNSGRYQFMTASEGALAFMGRINPGPRAIWDIAVASGLTATDAERDLAIDRYWEWTRDNNDTQTRVEWRKAETDTRTFRSNMRRAYVLMARENQTGNTIAKADEYLRAAIAVEGKDTSNAAISIRSRRLLPKVPDEQMDDLREFLKPDLFAALERHDAILDSWAGSFSRGQRSRTQRTRRRRRE